MPDTKAQIPSTVVADNYIKFKHEFLEFLFAELIDMRTIFEGDLDTLLIFISISRYYLRDERSHPGEEDADFGMHHHLTLSRIADLTRMRDALTHLVRACCAGSDPQCPILEALDAPSAQGATGDQ